MRKFKNNLRLIICLISYILVVILLNSMIVSAIKVPYISEINQLKSQIQNDELYIKALTAQIENSSVREQQLLDKIQAYEEVNSVQYYGIFKSYMDYRALNNPNLIEYKLQQRAITDERGFRKLDGCYMIAIGTGWNVKVGEKVLVVLSTGYSFKAIMGDTKSDFHTDPETHKVTIKPIPDGSVVEFIVDKTKIKTYIGNTGNVGTLDEFKGAVVGIYKID